MKIIFKDGSELYFSNDRHSIYWWTDGVYVFKKRLIKKWSIFRGHYTEIDYRAILIKTINRDEVRSIDWGE